LQQEDDLELLNLPQALNNHSATGSGKKIENLLPLPFSEIFRMPSLLPTTLRSKDFLSTTTNLSQPHFIAQVKTRSPEEENQGTNSTGGLPPQEEEKTVCQTKFRRDSSGWKSRQQQEPRREYYWRRQKLPVNQAQITPK